MDKGVLVEWELLLLMIKKERKIGKNVDGIDEVILEAIGKVSDWDKFVELAEHHRVYPIIYKAIMKVRENFPKDVISRLNEMYKNNTFNSLNQSGEIIRLAEQFSEDGLKVVFVKGVHQSQRIYNDNTLRPSRDIDILVEREQLDNVVAILKKNGYNLVDHEHEVIEKYKIRIDDKHIQVKHPLKGVLIEVHWKLLYWQWGERFTFKDVFEKSVEYNLAGIKIPVMTMDEQFTYYVCHGAEHGWFRLRWLLDVLELLKPQSGLNWEKIAIRIRENNFNALLGQGILLGKNLFDIEIDKLPSEIVEIYNGVSLDLLDKLGNSANAWIKQEVENYAVYKKSLFYNKYEFDILPDFNYKVMFGVYKLFKIPSKIIRETFYTIPLNHQ